MDDIEEGRAQARTPTSTSSAIVAFVRAIGLNGGDVLALQMTGPGSLAVNDAPQTLDRNKAQWMMFSGSKRPANGWPRGVYRGRFTVRRGGSVVLDRSFELRL